MIQMAGLHTQGLQMICDDGIVHELTEHGDRLPHGSGVSGTESVSDAKAHAVMLS